MVTSISLNKNSYQLTCQQRQIILILIKKYFANYLINGNFLHKLDFSKINFKWCYDFNDQNCIYGAWTPLFKDTLFLKPDCFNQQYLNFLEINNIETSQKNLWEMQYTYYLSDLIKFQNNQITYLSLVKENKIWVSNFNKYKFLKFLLDTLTHYFVSTVCHELYHKYQYSAIPILSPIYYYSSSFIGLFLPYSTQCKCKFLVEGDVREKIDNEQNYKCFIKFQQVFQYLNKKATRYRNKILLTDYANYLTQEVKQQIEQTENPQKLQTIEYKLIIQLCEQFKILSEDFLKFLLI